MSILSQIQEFISDEVDIEDLHPSKNVEVPAFKRKTMTRGGGVDDDLDGDIESPAYKRKLPLSKQRELGISDAPSKESSVLGGDIEKPAYMRKHGLIDKNDKEVPAFKRKPVPNKVLKPF
jgi:hypothetical protein